MKGPGLRLGFSSNLRRLTAFYELKCSIDRRLNTAMLEAESRRPRPGVADHHLDCDWQFEQYDADCVCGAARSMPVWFAVHTAHKAAPGLGPHPENLRPAELLGPEGRVMTRDVLR